MNYNHIKRNFLRLSAVIMLCISVSACGIGCLNRTATSVDEEVKANCFSCSLFTITYTAASKLAIQVYNNALPSASNFLAWAFVIWLIIEIAKVVGSVKAPDPGDFWKKVLFKFLICIVCVIIIKNTDNMIWFVNTFINPIFVGFINFASSTMTGSSCSFNPGAADASATAVMSAEPRDVMECLIGEIHVKLAFGKSLGRALVCHEESTIPMVLVGFLFIIAFSIIGVVFPFYVIDCIIRLGLALSLLPLFIMAFPFESTRRFTNKGFILFLDAGMTLAVISICMTLVTGITRHFISHEYPFIFKSDIQQINDFAGPGAGTLTLLFLIVLVFSSVALSASIAQGMVGSGIPNGVVSTAMKGIRFIVKAATTVAAIAATATGAGAVVGAGIKGADIAADAAADTAESGQGG